MCFFCPRMIRNVQSRRRFDSSSVITHPVNFDIQRERLLKCDAKNSTYIYIFRFSVAVQPEITALFTFQFFLFFFNVKKKSFSKLGRSVIGWQSGLIMLVFMDLRWPRAARRSNDGLVIHVFVVHYIIVYSYIWVKPNHLWQEVCALINWFEIESAPGCKYIHPELGWLFTPVWWLMNISWSKIAFQELCGFNVTVQI